MYEELISKRLTELRMQKGVSAREMSLDIGQNGSYINRIENGKSLPSMAGLFYICEYLQVTPSEFFATDNPHPQPIAQLAEELKSLSPEQLEIVRGIVAELKKLRK